MKKDTKLTDRQIKVAINNIITIGLPDNEQDKVIEECINLCDFNYDVGYDLGLQDGAIEYERNNPPINEEKCNSEYVTEMFADCTTFDEFKTIYNEIRNLSYTYMK